MQSATIQESFSSGTNGASASTSSFNQRQLNTVKTNSISGASLSSNVVSLPAGTYRLRAFSTAHGLQGHQLAIWDFTNNVALVNGLSDNVWQHSGVSTLSMSSTSFAEDIVILSATTNVGLNDWFGPASSGGTTLFGAAQSSGQPEVYAQLVIEQF